MYKVGVIGSLAGVERILDVAKEFTNEMEFYPFPYYEPKEIKDTVLKNDSFVDAWLFSGPAPYMISQKELQSSKDIVYISTTEAPYLKCLLDMWYEQGKMLKSISIDLPGSSMKYRHEPSTWIKMSPEDVYFITIDEKTLEELIECHLDLWNNGRIQGVITCFIQVSEALRKVGIPTYVLETSKMETRQALKILSEKVRTSYFKDTQIGIEIFEIENFDANIEKNQTPYHLEFTGLRLKETLLLLCKQLDGSLMEKGNGRYSIFSTRGAIERKIPELQETVHKLSLETNSQVAIGIGFGETVLLAENNAYKALQKSKEKPGRGIVMIQENGMIIEAVGEEENIAYFAHSKDMDLLNKLKKGNISIKAYNMIEALIRKMSWSEFKTKDLAIHLKMSERNAQRIMAYLCDVDLAECIGEESFHSKGRPSKIYRLKASL
ncbi:MAG: hypothetical protein ACQEWW_00060 [Bacillota bacterium]